MSESCAGIWLGVMSVNDIFAKFRQVVTIPHVKNKALNISCLDYGEDY